RPESAHLWITDGDPCCWGTVEDSARTRSSRHRTWGSSVRHPPAARDWVRSAEPRARSRSHRGSAPGRTRRGTRCPDERRRSPRPPSPRPGSNGDLASHNALIDAAAVEAGRSPGDIRRLLNLGADLTVDRLAELALEHGVSVFVFEID